MDEEQVRKAFAVAEDLASTCDETYRRDAFIAVFHSMVGDVEPPDIDDIIDDDESGPDQFMAAIDRQTESNGKWLALICEAIAHSQLGDAEALDALKARLKASSDALQQAVANNPDPLASGQ